MCVDFDYFLVVCLVFFFNDTATTEIYTLSLHDALPISMRQFGSLANVHQLTKTRGDSSTDRKSTRLNSSHLVISYAVFCLKNKNSNFLDADPISPTLDCTRHAAASYAK